jgi:hypothetical protein
VLDKKVFVEGLRDLLDFFPGWNMRANDPTVLAKWYTRFEDFTNEEFKKCVSIYVRTSKDFPTVAGLYENRSYAAADSLFNKGEKDRQGEWN